MNKLIDGTDNKFIKDNIEDIFNRLQNLLIKKGEEYVGGRKDRFHSFNKTALRLNQFPEEILSNFQSKHITSIDDMIEDLAGGVYHSISQWQEKDRRYDYLLSSIGTNDKM